MTFTDTALEHGVLERLGRGERSQGIRDSRPRLAQTFSELLLREVVGLHEQLVPAGGLDRVEVGPLEVLDERQLKTIACLVADHRRDARPAGKARREDPAVSGDELVPIAVA